jgi:hypothetical protein
MSACLVLFTSHSQRRQNSQRGLCDNYHPHAPALSNTFLQWHATTFSVERGSCVGEERRVRVCVGTVKKGALCSLLVVCRGV